VSTQETTSTAGGGPGGTNILELTSEIAAGYMAHNSLPANDVPGFIGSIFTTLTGLQSGGGTGLGGQTTTTASKEPAVSIKKSVTPDAIICLEDGKQFKSLKRHLRTVYGMTPEQYRAKWGLPATYPMVAPNYAAARSELAKKMGLGNQRRTGQAAAGKTTTTATGTGRRSRAKKAA